MAGAQTSLTLQDRMSGPLQKIMKAMDSTIKVMEQMNQAANLDTTGIERAQSAIQSANAAMARYMSETDQGLGGNTSQQEGLNNEIRAGTMNMKGFAVAVLSAVGAYKAFNATKDFLSNIFSQGIEFHAFKQASEAAFTTFLGDAATAKQYMDDMYAFALTTPFAYPDLLESSRNLIAFGMTAENTFPVMQAIGDAVAGIGGGNAEMQRLSEIFGMIQVQGKLSLMEVNRLGSLGVNAIDMLAESAGVSGEEIRKQISAGAVDAGTAISALVDGMDKQFGGLMDGVKDTWAGAIDSMKSSMRNAGTAMMADFMEPLTEAVGHITNVFRNLPTYVGPAVAAFLPLIAMLNEAFNENRFDGIFAGLSASLTFVATTAANAGMVMIWMLTEISAVGSLIASHWDLIGPVIVVAGSALVAYIGIMTAFKLAVLGAAAAKGILALQTSIQGAMAMFATGHTIAQTVAQHGLNAAIYAFPGTWILIAFVAVIALVIFAMVRWAEEAAAVFGAIVGGIYWLGAAFHNVIMFIVNMAIAGAEWFANVWNQGVFMVQMAFIAFVFLALTVLDAIGNAAIAVAEWFVNTWNQAMFMVQMAWIGLNIMARMVLDAIGNAALSAAEWFINTWNDGIYGVQMAFHQMGVFVGSIMSGVASGVVGVVNMALGAISSLINAATSGVNAFIGILNSVLDADISTIGTVDLKLGSGITNFASDIGKNLVAPTKAANVSLGRMNTAGDYMSGMSMPTAPGQVSFGKMNTAGDYLSGITMPEAPTGKADFGRFDYTSLGDAFDRGQQVGSNLSLGASDKLSSGIDMLTGLLSGPDFDAMDVGEIPNMEYDPSNGAGVDGSGNPLAKPGSGKSPSGSGGGAGGSGGGKGGANPTGGKLDSIGKIDSEISIADEDLKMFRELADRESIRQATVTLTPSFTFKDTVIREEADVDKIISGIEKSMKDEVARSAEGVYT